MYHSETWWNVPAGSRLAVELKVGGGDTAVAGYHTHTRADGAVLQGTLSTAHFPLSIPLGKQEQCDVKVEVVGLSDVVDLEVVGRIVKPDGSIYGDPSPARAKLTQHARTLTAKFFAIGER